MPFLKVLQISLDRNLWQLHIHGAYYSSDVSDIETWTTFASVHSPPEVLKSLGFWNISRSSSLLLNLFSDIVKHTFLSSFSFFVTGYCYVAQARLKFSTEPRLTQNWCSFCLCLTAAGIPGRKHPPCWPDVPPCLSVVFPCLCIHISLIIECEKCLSSRVSSMDHQGHISFLVWTAHSCLDIDFKACYLFPTPCHPTAPKVTLTLISLFNYSWNPKAHKPLTPVAPSNDLCSSHTLLGRED